MIQLLTVPYYYVYSYDPFSVFCFLFLSGKGEAASGTCWEAARKHSFPTLSQLFQGGRKLPDFISCLNFWCWCSGKHNTFIFLPFPIHTYIHTYIHTLLRLPSTGLFSHNVNYYIILVIKKRKENLFTVVQLNSKYIQNYSKYIQNYFVWNILLKSLRLKLSISLVFLILSGSPFHSFGPRK